MVAIIPGIGGHTLNPLARVLEKANICQNPTLITRATVNI